MYIIQTTNKPHMDKLAHFTDNKFENLTCGWVARTPESNSLLSRSCRTYLENWRKGHPSYLVSCQFFEHRHHWCDNHHFEMRGSHHCSVGVQPKRLGLDKVGKIGHLRMDIMRMTIDLFLIVFYCNIEAGSKF